MPIVVWIISFALSSSLGRNSGAIIYFSLVFVQLVLFILAIYLGIKILRNRKDNYSKNDKKHAVVGLMIVGITLLLIFVAIIFNL